MYNNNYLYIAQCEEKNSLNEIKLLQTVAIDVIIEVHIVKPKIKIKKKSVKQQNSRFDCK
jgi:hypothetical protein